MFVFVYLRQLFTLQVKIGNAEYHCACLRYVTADNTALIIGVAAAGVVLLLVLIIIIVVIVVRRRRRNKQTSQAATAPKLQAV